MVFYCVFVVLLRDGAVELGGHGHFSAAVGPLGRPLLLPLCGDGVPGGDRECLQSGHYSAPHHLCPLRSSRQHHCMCRGTAQVHFPHIIPLQIILPKTNTCIFLLFPNWSKKRRMYSDPKRKVKRRNYFIIRKLKAVFTDIRGTLLFLLLTAGCRFVIKNIYIARLLQTYLFWFHRQPLRGSSVK